MNVLKGLYHDGIVEMIENPKANETSEVYVIFPEKQKKIKKLRGLFKEQKLDYEQIENDLKELGKKSEEHLLEEFKDYE